jgi:hypothetical protein
MRSFTQDFSGDRYQIDSNGVVRTIQYCSPGCSNPRAAARFNDTGYAIYYQPEVGLQLNGGSAGNASRIAMFADGDPVAIGYEQIKCAVGANSTFQCYWDDTGVPGDWWYCDNFFVLARSGTILSSDDGCYSRPPLLWRPSNESTAKYTLGPCSP